MVQQPSDDVAAVAAAVAGGQAVAMPQDRVRRVLLHSCCAPCSARCGRRSSCGSTRPRCLFACRFASLSFHSRVSDETSDEATPEPATPVADAAAAGDGSVSDADAAVTVEDLVVAAGEVDPD